MCDCACVYGCLECVCACVCVTFAHVCLFNGEVVLCPDPTPRGKEIFRTRFRLARD